MPAALGMEQREEIIKRRERKESFRSISEEMGIAYATVRSVWRHWKSYGQVEPRYENCGQRGPRKAQEVYEAAMALREQHRRWGAVLIRLHLLEEFEAADVPAERTLQSWFRQAGLNRTPATQQSKEQVSRGQAVHEVWAVDAKEKMRLGDGTGASWLTITDEASGAVLDASVFPPLSLEPGGPAQGEKSIAGDL